MKSGMKVLIEGLYESIRGNAPVPIPYAEILRTARIMDAIFAQTCGKPGQNSVAWHERDLTEVRVALPSTP
jgi:hypothetical protein